MRETVGRSAQKYLNSAVPAAGTSDTGHQNVRKAVLIHITCVHVGGLRIVLDQDSVERKIAVTKQCPHILVLQHRDIGHAVAVKISYAHFGD